jgi:hypothetical protein
MTKGRVWEADRRRTAVPIFVSGLSRLVVSVARPDYDEPERRPIVASLFVGEYVVSEVLTLPMTSQIRRDRTVNHTYGLSDMLQAEMSPHYGSS